MGSGTETRLQRVMRYAQWSLVVLVVLVCIGCFIVWVHSLSAPLL